MIQLICKCGHEFRLEDDKAGGTIQCPQCGLLSDIPRPQDLKSIGKDGTYKLDQPPVLEHPGVAEQLIDVYSRALYHSELYRAAAAAKLGPPGALGESDASVRRLLSLDAFRGMVMVLLISAGLRIPEVVRSFDRVRQYRHLKNATWEWLAHQTAHSAWAGCTFWDLIQPCFMFIVGAALAFSFARRRGQGQSFGLMFKHAIVRSLVLILLGVFLISNGSDQTEWSFTNVLSQIGLGYIFLFLLAWLGPRWQAVATVAILAAYWTAFATYPAPPANLHLASVGLPADWDRLHGFASHWDKNTNWAAHFDQWFLNLFPRPDHKPFLFNDGGYPTLNFVPSLATMLFGLLTGELLRSRKSGRQKLVIMLGAGVGALMVGWALGWLGICPVVKRIWTPSWTIYSAGWTLLAMSLFYWIIETRGAARWSLPLVIVGMNSIVLYCISMLLEPWFDASWRRHFGSRLSEMFGRPYAPMVDAGLFLVFCWAAAWLMYRKRIFVRI